MGLVPRSYFRWPGICRCVGTRRLMKGAAADRRTAATEDPFAELLRLLFPSDGKFQHVVHEPGKRPEFARWGILLNRRMATDDTGRAVGFPWGRRASLRHHLVRPSISTSNHMRQIVDGRPEKLPASLTRTLGRSCLG